MKKITNLILTLCIALGLFAILSGKASAATYSGSCGTKLNWSLDTATGVLTITGSGKMADYSDKAPWYSHCQYIKTVSIDSRATSIGARAFTDCDSLTSVTIPDSVTSIGDYAFRDCGSLQSASIGTGVTTIGKDAFSDCKSLTAISVNLSNSKYLAISGVLFGKDTFAPTALIHYPAGKTDTQYSILYGVTSISESAFKDCDNLTSITIPDSVESIGDCAFRSCDNLQSVTVSKNVATIGTDAFLDCASLANITINGNNPNYATTDGVLFGKDSEGNPTVLIKYPAGKTNAEYTIPDGTTTIERDAFLFCTNLTDVTISDDVTTIASSAFSGCTGLEHITIPDTVVSIGDSAFWYCESLESIRFPTGITSISDSAFWGCASLEEVELTGNLLSIGSLAFYNCKSLKNIEIPESVENIGDSAFQYAGLTGITIPEATTIGADAFSGCKDLASITVDENNEKYSSIDGVLFGKDSEGNPTVLIHYPAGKTDTKYIIPNSTKSIGEGAFQYCPSLTTVILCDSTTSIGESAFWCCDNLQRIIIPDSTTNIGGWAFGECDSLATVYYASNKTDWDKISIGSSNKPLSNASFNWDYGIDSLDIIGNLAKKVAETTVDETKVFAGFGKGTTLDELSEALLYHGSTYVKLYDGDGNQLTEGSTVLATGYKLCHFNEYDSLIQSVLISVDGDVTGDGAVDYYDLIGVIRYIAGSDSGIYKIAVDTDLDGTLSMQELNTLIASFRQ